MNLPLEKYVLGIETSVEYCPQITKFYQEMPTIENPLRFQFDCYAGFIPIQTMEIYLIFGIAISKYKIVMDRLYEIFKTSYYSKKMLQIFNDVISKNQEFFKCMKPLHIEHEEKEEVFKRSMNRMAISFHSKIRARKVFFKNKFADFSIGYDFPKNICKKNSCAQIKTRAVRFHIALGMKIEGGKS